MSLREKLLSLIDKIEDLDLEAEVEEVLEEEITELAEEIPAPEFIEVPYEECEAVLDAQKAALEARATLADIIFQYEKTKQYLISKIDEHHNELKQAVTDLREQKNLPPDADYTFTVPEVGESGSFELKKE